jgi:uncharacterized protein YutE (UPF0331/DUF86 family)
LLRKDLIWSRIGEIRESAVRLAEFKQKSLGTFLTHKDNPAIAEHHLRRALECTLDIARHILAKRGKRRPQDYGECFDLLGQEGILPSDFAQGIKGMAGYRNRLVHLYWEVTNQELFQLIDSKLEDFEKFCQHIINYVEKEN